MKRSIRQLLLVLLCLMLFCMTALAQSVPYTVRLKGSVKIYKGHGVDYGYSKNVGSDGVYTIVEEAFDEYGNLWGRLKSGAGWVMLEEKKQTAIHDVPYTTSLKGTDDIYAGPGYEHGKLKDVGTDGIYTIVEETVDNDGFLWGRLKSGAGWVRLTGAPMESTNEAYTVSLGAWVPIYNIPSEEDGTCIATVGQDGVYTIVSEVEDRAGNIWGELKSGAGWVNLNYVRSMGDPQMTACFADVVDSIEAYRCDCVVDGSENMVRIAFRANKRLRDINFMTLRYDGSYEVEENHCTIQQMEKGEYFVAGVVFYGDMTTYGISFLDENGEERNYAVSISGLNGSLVMNEYVK